MAKSIRRLFSGALAGATGQRVLNWWPRRDLHSQPPRIELGASAVGLRGRKKGGASFGQAHASNADALPGRLCCLLTGRSRSAPAPKLPAQKLMEVASRHKSGRPCASRTRIYFLGGSSTGRCAKGRTAPGCLFIDAPGYPVVKTSPLKESDLRWSIINRLFYR